MYKLEDLVLPIWLLFLGSLSLYLGFAHYTSFPEYSIIMGGIFLLFSGIGFGGLK